MDTVPSEHVVHLPSLGIKVDACIGRLNATSLFALRPGVFFWSVVKFAVWGTQICRLLSKPFRFDNYVQ